MQLAEMLMDKVTPDGLAVVMEADHFCMHWRGVKDAGAKMVTSVMRGSFLKDASLRCEFLALINPFACSGRATMALLDELVATASIVYRGG